ncbi:hypothetical protein HNP98_002326 [Hymenobacter sp. 9A]|uniref:Uncharacterized protein n=1 Tax=Hymenobacter caeli TaxID=2735894 RepID=A0ABX2FQP5_9BACT|nr:hypothetical protein [Hymenobacter caeli]
MKPAHKWLLRAALTALAVLLTTDRRRPSAPAPKAKKPAE